jgi:ATP-dependent Clp endopeptidase proteolytic subunit ClpP
MFNLSKKNKDEKEKEETINLSDLESVFSEAPKMRIIGIYGDINEERCSEAIYGLKYLAESGLMTAAMSSTEEEQVAPEPIEFCISTYGGAAMDMFAVYDTMRQVREYCPIQTVGMGKVMSAGVLLLAAGTKGERRIGKNCRVMIHGVISGQHGHLHDVENEFEEAKITQKQYVKALAAETNMTETHLRKLIQRKTNVYIDAEEALELGIADVIF